MRRRSRTNSRPQEDLDLRQRYREDHLWCALAGIACGSQRHDATEIHHLGRLGGRWDLWGNLIALCDDAHRWCHAHEPDGRLVCAASKVMQGEFCQEEWFTANGKRIEWLSDCAVPQTEPGRAAQEFLKEWLT